MDCTCGRSMYRSAIDHPDMLDLLWKHLDWHERRERWEVPTDWVVYVRDQHFSGAGAPGWLFGDVSALRLRNRIVAAELLGMGLGSELGVNYGRGVVVEVGAQGTLVVPTEYKKRCPNQVRVRQIP